MVPLVSSNGELVRVASACISQAAIDTLKRYNIIDLVFEASPHGQVVGLDSGDSGDVR